MERLHDLRDDGPIGGHFPFFPLSGGSDRLCENRRGVEQQHENTDGAEHGKTDEQSSRQLRCTEALLLGNITRQIA